MNQVRLMWVGVAIIVVGFLVVALGASAGSGGSSSSGGFILDRADPDSLRERAGLRDARRGRLGDYGRDGRGIPPFVPPLRSERRREVGVGTESG